ncbi:type I-E CRISPR-associated protein Cas7/Cse4/CasC [Streptomyces sp. NBC_00102]|uniref:type I-E CRISPR-associated protein Cas7/Cse4/CasC n=1 Tax=Streptomyces sp. NBC_00102 TaxID=2975652 RepID=UPI0022582490|nr:type I-E CRISPR-associated protein Cas7/Cse4/CasC [Streptomyces sp. NBC_00102]MCX5398422.1 type I-E CRISPR-associated protein Cas7/Cse4/CasC [Streptomyces sp. NBC_00102]
MTRTIIDVHVLQTVPPSNLNRDDTGAPKTAVYGGVRRSRVSSQAWKRSTRRAFGELLDPSELGVRTRKVVELLAERIGRLDPSLGGTAGAEGARADELVLAFAAETIKVATGSKVEVPKRKAKNAKDGDEEAVLAPESLYLMFLSSRQLDGLAELAVEGLGSERELKDFFADKEIKARARALADSRHSVDIALFGRMVADAADINVDAAAQVAHALSVHAVENESDYFTAVDDRNTDSESGAGMIGTVDFNSATLYRYAALDVDRLRDNLGAGLDEDRPGSEPVRRAVEAFVHAFVNSIPTGKINTFANHTLPDAVVVKLRTARPVSFVGAFEKPVTADVTGGHLEGACRALAAYVPEVERAYGAGAPGSTWVVRVGSATQALAGLGEELSLDGLVKSVGNAVESRLGGV